MQRCGAECCRGACGFHSQVCAFKRDAVCNKSIAIEPFICPRHHPEGAAAAQTDVAVLSCIDAVAEVLHERLIPKYIRYIDSVIDQFVLALKIKDDVHRDIQRGKSGIVRFTVYRIAEILHGNGRFIPADKTDITIRLIIR